MGAQTARRETEPGRGDHAECDEADRAAGPSPPSSAVVERSLVPEEAGPSRPGTWEDEPKPFSERSGEPSRSVPSEAPEVEAPEAPPEESALPPSPESSPPPEPPAPKPEPPDDEPTPAPPESPADPEPPPDPEPPRLPPRPDPREPPRCEPRSPRDGAASSRPDSTGIS